MLAACPVQSAVAQPYDDTEARNLATVRAGFDAWRNGTGSTYEALADDATWEIVGNSLARMAAPLRPTIRDIYADGDTVIVFFDAEGIARDGVPYRNTYTWFLTLRDNRIVKASAFFDSIAFNDLWQRVPA